MRYENQKIINPIQLVQFDNIIKGNYIVKKIKLHVNKHTNFLISNLY